MQRSVIGRQLFGTLITYPTGKHRPNEQVHELHQIQTARRRPRGGLHPGMDGRGMLDLAKDKPSASTRASRSWPAATAISWCRCVLTSSVSPTQRKNVLSPQAALLCGHRAQGRQSQPMGIAEYKLFETRPVELQTSLPSIEQIERELVGDGTQSDEIES